MGSLMEDLDIGNARILDPFIANSPASVEILLIVGRVQRREGQAQARAGREPPCGPFEFERNLHDLARLQQFLTEGVIAKARAANILAQARKL